MQLRRRERRVGCVVFVAVKALFCFAARRTGCCGCPYGWAVASWCEGGVLVFAFLMLGHSGCFSWGRKWLRDFCLNARHTTATDKKCDPFPCCY